MQSIDNLRIETLSGGSGILSRLPARVVATTNIVTTSDLNGAVIDGITLSTGDRILLIAQTTATENGVWVVGTGINATIRAGDFRAGDSVAGVSIGIASGTVYAQTIWIVTGIGSAAIVGTGSLDFVMRSISSYATGDLFYALTSTTLARLAKPSVTSILQETSGGTPSWVALTSAPNIYNLDGTIAANRAVTVADKILNFSTTTGGFYVNGSAATASKNGILSDATNLDSSGSPGTMIYKRLDNGSGTKTLTICAAGDYFAQTDQNISLGYVASPTYNLVQSFSNRVDISSGNIFTGLATDSVYMRLQKSTNTMTLNATTIALQQSPATATPTSALGLNGSNQLVKFTPSVTASTILSYYIATNATNSWTTIAYLSWHNTVYGSAATRRIYFEVVYVNRGWSLRIWNGSTDLNSTISGSSSQFTSTPFDNPGANARLEIQIRKTAGGGTAPTFYGIQVVLQN